MSKENTPGAQAQAPRGINHLVLNVRNLEASHRFWTEIIGFHCVAELKPIPGRKQLEFLQSKGVPFHRRTNHGMTHSVYISDPDGHGIEVLYELPREVWEHDIDGAQNYSEQLPTEGEASLVDRTDNPVFREQAPSVAGRR